MLPVNGGMREGGELMGAALIVVASRLAPRVSCDTRWRMICDAAGRLSATTGLLIPISCNTRSQPTRITCPSGERRP